MSKRLQVVLPDDEYRALTEAARRQGKPVAAVVRDSLRKALAQAETSGPEERLAAILRFARFSGPTGDIEQLLEEIARGRDSE
ncbi:MAG TPA: CopG family transcriptional regulator [Tepidiformaceae bacterium]|nr:CopG family transcriptional regulator [Tepidiformaceae bacterium]